MAVGNIKKAFKKDLLDTLRASARDKSSMTHAHVITINSTLFSVGMEKGINLAAQAQGFNNGLADFSKIRSHTQEVQNAWVKGKHGLSGVTTKFEKGNLTVIRRAKSAGQYVSYARLVCQKFRQDVFNLWKQDTGIGANWDSDTAKIIGEETPFSHSKETNVANAGLVQWIEESSAEIVPVESNISAVDIAQKVLDALDIQWSQEVDPITKKMIWVITGDLTAKQFNPEAGMDDLTQPWVDRILTKFDQILDDENLKINDPYFVASKSFGEVIEEETVRDIVKPYKRLRDAKGRFVKMPKKNKKTNRTGSVKKSKKSEGTKSNQIKIAAVATSMRKERGASAHTEEGAVQLARLKKYIQSRLPAEVRRNMGRPALINQTGRFSNSVQLMSLMEGKNTLIAKYTYLLAPYETFENTGKKRWPLAYNPKTLIAKSIRNLAQGRIEQKLTLRRV